MQISAQLPADLEVIQDIDLDLDPPVSLVACHLAAEFGYQDAGDVTGEFTTSVPFPVRLDLDRLV